MAEPFHLLIVAPGKTLYDGKADSLVIPAADGMMGVLSGHAPFYGILKPGTISVNAVSSPGLTFKVTGGSVQVLPAEVTILAEAADSNPGP